MKFPAVCFLLALIAAPSSPEPAFPYFTNVRDVRIAQPDRQNFFIVDEELWNHSRADLADLRLYDGETPVQYALSEQSAGLSSEEVKAKILNLGSVAGHTEFDLDTNGLTGNGLVGNGLAGNGLSEYDRIRLRLDAHDFVATASVSGSNELGKTAKVELASSALYDFTKEQLGSNFQLKIAPSSFRYLHVRLSPGIRPQQVKGATAFNVHERKASWTDVGSCLAPQQKGHLSVIVCNVPPKVPLDRIVLQVDPARVNFRRNVNVNDISGQISNSEINRVRMTRGGTLVTDESLSVNCGAAQGRSGQITVTVDNGDNPPLEITSATPQSIERRVYFDSQGKAALHLYYGDNKLTAPVYDYARFFHVEPSSTQAQLEAGMHNPQFTGRPDDRPWSEQHKAVLWAAMLLAVFALAVLALRGLRA
jgi:hypothetical protein